MPNPYSFVMGLEPDDDMKRRRAEAAAKDVPAFSDREMPPAAPGGDWEGVESIGRAADDIRRRVEERRAPREGIQGIQDTALDILARARAQGGRR